MNPYKPPKTQLDKDNVATGNLSVISTFLGTFLIINQKKLALSRAATIPLVGFILTGIMEQHAFGLIPSLLSTLANLCVYSLFAVNIHRVVLASQDSHLDHKSLRWTTSEWQFLLYSLLVYLCFIPIGFIFLIPTVGIFIGIIVAVWLMGRFCLVFPSIALKERLTLAQSWTFTAPFQFKILIISGIFYASITLPIYFLTPLMDNYIAAAFIEALTGMVVVISLSLIYHQIKSFNQVAYSQNIKE